LQTKKEHEMHARLHYLL